MIARLIGLATIAPRELHRRMQAESWLAFDLNARASWLAARVPGSRHLDPTFDASRLPADRDALLVFYCSNPLCRKAANAARRAKDTGYRNVHVMSAGIRGWLGASLPTECGEVQAV